jgi:hypothetical protein
MRDHDWPFLRKLCTITTADTVAGYTINSGSGATEYTCDRIIPDVQYDATNDWRFVGSVGDDVWYAYQFGTMTAPIRKIWRTTSKTAIEVFPVPTGVETLKVPFVTDKWVTDATGAAAFRASFTVDTDLHLFDWDLFDEQVLWRFMEMKGLDYSAALKRATEKLDQRVAALSNPGTLSLRPRAGWRPIDYSNVPETGHGV